MIYSLFSVKIQTGIITHVLSVITTLFSPQKTVQFLGPIVSITTKKASFRNYCLNKNYFSLSLPYIKQ